MATTTKTRTQHTRSAGSRGGASGARNGARATRLEHAEHGFTASPQLIGHLQAVLVDLIELATQMKQAHWSVVGRNFRDLHLQLDEIIEEARRFGDEVAERLRALHGVPDGRSTTVAATTTLGAFPDGEVDTAETVDLVTARVEAVVATCRRVHDEVDEEDPTTSDLLHEIIARFEQFAWMVSAENRTPASR
ncbi:MAG: DNA starvation/stationary phase protection protein [Microbacteriaceae bacterium]|nr:DNA starvation/stationary phase protection protein [Microbacteriaceae bacterium]